LCLHGSALQHGIPEVGALPVVQPCGGDLNRCHSHLATCRFPEISGKFVCVRRGNIFRIRKAIGKLGIEEH